MLKYIRNNLKERELEDRIINHPDLIEENLRYIEHQRNTAYGRLDVLFVDGNNTLVVAELKVIEDPNMLIQALDYFDFVYEKLEGFANLYAAYKIDTSKYPRLMLIAPSFSPLLINRCRWITPDIRISLVQYQYIQFKEANEDTLVFIPQEISFKPATLKKAPELNELLNYIRDEHIREIAKKFLDETKKLSKNISIDPLQWGKSVKYKGNVVYYWEPRQTCIRVSTYNMEGKWEGTNVIDEEGFTTVFNYIKNNIKNLK